MKPWTQADKDEVERQTSLEHARTEWEPHAEVVARLNRKEIARELSTLTELKRKRFRTPKEL